MSETVNGIQRELYEEVCEILKEFWRAQPAWGDASIEGYYAEKIIHRIQNYDKLTNGGSDE